jgi:hypothetical protein
LAISGFRVGEVPKAFWFQRALQFDQIRATTKRPTSRGGWRFNAAQIVHKKSVKALKYNINISNPSPDRRKKHPRTTASKMFSDLGAHCSIL